ncbi:MAG: glycosyltransferase [Lachnospiraceae bacterium]|nr:glycosyltransferase [Lachnospiraceae bacterium]
MEKVSVIVPVYNVEAYLRECLESIINQTYKELEILCINDCSTDGSLAVLKEYEQNDPRIVILENEKNGGLAYTRNTGLERATGEYVLFVDSDDTIAPDLVKSCMEVVSECDMVCFDYEQMTADTAIIARQYAYKMKDGLYTGEAFFKEFVGTDSTIFSAWSKLVSRKFLVENHISFYDGILYEDMLFTFQCLIKARKVYSLNRKLYRYRVRQTSIMTTGITGKSIESYMISICEMMKLYLQNDFCREMNQAIEGYIRKVSREYISVYRKWENRTFEPALLKDKPEYLKLYRTFSELFLQSGKLLHITAEQAEKIRQYPYVILYGAGDIARSAVEMLDQYDISIYGIAVSNTSGNKKSLLGNSVKELQDYHEIKEKCLVLIATIPRYYSEIREQLRENGFFHWMEMIEVNDGGENDR